MIVGIDARMLGSGFGIGRYIEQLLHHLQKSNSPHEFVVFLRKENWDQIGESGRVRKVLADVPWYSAKEQWQLSHILTKERINLMHFPHWNVPLAYRGPFVVTIHDLIMYHYPRPEATTLGPVRFWIKDTVHRRVVAHAVRAASHILTTSEWTRRDIHTTFGAPMEKMTVTYQAPFVHQGGALASREILGERYGIHKPYALYVGAAYPHKNLEGLLEAWKQFQEKDDGARELVLAGKENYFYTRLRPLIEQTPTVVYTGFVPDDVLGALYRNAALYVFPSLYEGFGLPPLEAMSYGVPVVSSSGSCLPEVLGEAALYMDPKNPSDMAQKIHTGFSDEDVRATLRMNAKEELRRYSWERLAKETVAVYEKAVN